MLTTGASITGTLQVKKIEIRPTLSTDLSYMFGETADFDVKVGSATSVEQAAYGDISLKHRLPLPLSLGCRLEKDQ